MKQTFVTLIFLFFFPTSALAAGFELAYEEDKFNPDQKTLASFQGLSNLSKNSYVKKNSPDLNHLLSSFLGNPQEQNLETLHFQHRIDRIYQFVKKLSENINQGAIEPKLVMEESRAVEFIVPENGKKLDIYASTMNALEALEAGLEKSILVVNTTAPKMTLAETNNFGIKELIGRGESDFSGSPSNRRHNIKVGAEKIKGVVLKPGEEFSFNKFLGPVIAEEGYLPELVIKRSGTVPELGGGLCQVSSTTFRAAIEAGIPITERKNHSYAVVYYAPQGTDATIYPGYVDLKFVNDTQGHLLIWPYLKDSNSLVFDFYGTKDERDIVISDPVQYDKKPDGSMKATWTREVTLNGETKVDTFKSTYLPPALFHEEQTFVGSEEEND